jgi:hypothetical protein
MRTRCNGLAAVGLSHAAMYGRLKYSMISADSTVPGAKRARAVEGAVLCQ